MGELVSRMEGGGIGRTWLGKWMSSSSMPIMPPSRSANTVHTLHVDTQLQTLARTRTHTTHATHTIMQVCMIRMYVFIIYIYMYIYIYTYIHTYRWRQDG